MKKISINYLYIEVTRKCTMKCNHCLRGDSQNISLNILSNTFSFRYADINIINSIHEINSAVDNSNSTNKLEFVYNVISDVISILFSNNMLIININSKSIMIEIIPVSILYDL